MLSAVAAHLDINYGSTHAAVHTDLKHRKVCALWVSIQLIDLQKQQGVGVAT